MAEFDVGLTLGYDSPSQLTKASLLYLPAEIRNMVYIYTLGGNVWCINVSGGHPKPRADNATKHALALLRVNRQIYAETHLFPYLYNTFEGRHNGHLREWVQSLPAPQCESITCIRYCQRGYLIQGSHFVDVNPTFWMDVPNVTQWRLPGLKRVDIEVALHKWSVYMNEEEVEAAKSVVLSKLHTLVARGHPGVTVTVALRHGY